MMAQATTQSEVGCRLFGHGFAGQELAAQSTAAAELDSGRGCTGSFRARLGGGEYEMACWPTPSLHYISL